MGGMKTPGALVVASIPSVNVPVCAVNGVRESPCANESPCVEETPCVPEPPVVSVPSCVTETPCATPSTRESPCASGVVTSVPACVFPGTPCVKGALQLGETTCAREAARVCEPPRVCETPRVSAPACVSDGVCVGDAPGVSDRPCVSNRVCAVAVHTGDGGGHARTCSRVSRSEYECECCVQYGRRDTLVCEA